MDKEYLEYNIMEMNYRRIMGKGGMNNPNENRDLYPTYWFGVKDYNKKKQILKEAIEKKCLIQNTKGYLDIIEGVKVKKDKGEER